MVSLMEVVPALHELLAETARRPRGRRRPPARFGSGRALRRHGGRPRLWVRHGIAGPLPGPLWDAMVERLGQRFVARSLQRQPRKAYVDVFPELLQGLLFAGR